MSLENLLNQGKLKHHRTSKKEIANLLILTKRDIQDAKLKGLSTDRKFATAYNVVLQLATILLYSKGYKPEGTAHHFTAFQAMKGVLGKSYYGLADYFDSCRTKRNITDYSYAGGVSEKEAEELIKEAEDFLNQVLNWLKANYPELL